MRLAATFLSLLLLAPAAAAEVVLNAGETVFAFGDLRLRAEADWDSSRDDGTERDDRNRGRLRLRGGFKWKPSKHFSTLVRARTGNTDSQQSPHVTIIQSGDKGDADLLIDRLWVQGSWSRGSVWAGRNGHPFWRQDEFLFDDDIWLDGLGFRISAGGEGLKQEVRGGFGALPEGTASLDWDEQGRLYGLQYAISHDDPEGRGLTAALAAIRIEDEPGVANPVIVDLDWTVWALQVQGRVKGGERPLVLGFDWFRNGDRPPKGTWNRDERDGFALFVKYGGLRRKGDWLIAGYYARIEQFALVPFLAQDDWLRWGSATQTRSSNYEGLELRAGYAFNENMNLLARLYLVEGIELRSPAAVAKEDGKRFRLDFNWRF